MPYKDPERQREFNRSPKQRAYMNAYYKTNIEKFRTARKRGVQAGLEVVREAKNQPCLDCGQSYPYYVMDFHHRDPSEKLGSPTALATTGASRARLLAEIAKCDVLCANCHRIRTHKES